LNELVDVSDSDAQGTSLGTARRCIEAERLVDRSLPLGIAVTCPLEDRTGERKVFAGFNGDVAKNVMARASKVASIPHFSAHSLRHRRVSIWHHEGIPAPGCWPSWPGTRGPR
jgi:integrase